MISHIVNLRYHLLPQRLILGFFVLLGFIFLGLFSIEQYRILMVLLSLCILPVIIYLSVKYPESMLWLCLMLYFTPGGEWPGNILVVFWGTVLVFHRFLIKKIRISLDPILYLWIFILLNLVITVPKWLHLFKAFRGSIHFVFIPLIIYLSMAKGLIDDKGCDRFIGFYLPLAISYAIIQLSLKLLFSLEFFGHYVMRAHTGINLGWGYSNTLAAIMVLFASVIISHPGFKAGKILQRLWFYYLLFIAITTPFIIISRGAVISFLLGTILYLIFQSIMTGNLQIKKWLLFSGIVVIIVIVFFYSYLYALIWRFQNLRMDISTFTRLHLIMDSLNAMRHNLLIGVGPNQRLFSEFYRYLEDPHNIFLRYGVDFGLISMLAFLLILIYPLSLLLKSVKKDKNKTLAIYGQFMLPYYVAICNSQIEAAITKYHYGIIFWTFYGLAIRRLHRVTSDSEK